MNNFKKLASDPSFKAALINTIIYSIGTVPLTMVFSLLLAIILNRKIFGRYFFRTVSFFPYVASLVAVAVVWNMLFNPANGLDSAKRKAILKNAKAELGDFLFDVKDVPGLPSYLKRRLGEWKHGQIWLLELDYRIGQMRAK